MYDNNGIFRFLHHKLIQFFFIMCILIDSPSIELSIYLLSYNVNAALIYYEVLFPPNYIGTLAVGVVAAKESLYLEEWLAHHFYYGVDKIVVSRPTYHGSAVSQY